jgi:DNA-binding response OmpR family regulator
MNSPTAKVLLVEDDATIPLLLAVQLKDANLELTCAADAGTADPAVCREFTVP